MEQLLAVALGSALTFGVVVFERWASDRQDYRKWQRDEKVESYSQFAANYFTVWNRTRALQPGTPSRDEAALRDVRLSGEAFKASLARMRLLGDPSVYAAACEVYSGLDRLVPSTIQSDKTKDVEWLVAHQKAHLVFLRFIDAARGDIGALRISVGCGGGEEVPVGSAGVEE